jgi:hypothetical protein
VVFAVDIISSSKSLFSDDDVAQLKALTTRANLLSIGSHDLIEKVSEMPEVFLQLMKFLKQDDNP